MFCKLFRNPRRMCIKHSFLGGWRYALAVSLDEQSFGRQAAWRRHALKRNLNVSLNIIFTQREPLIEAIKPCMIPQTPLSPLIFIISAINELLVIIRHEKT